MVTNHLVVNHNLDGSDLHINQSDVSFSKTVLGLILDAQATEHEHIKEQREPLPGRCESSCEEKVQQCKHVMKRCG
jgi:hypothetical protein